jgi:flagellar hook-associated protein 1 FlgK
MSLQSLLSIARSALGAHQRAMEVTAHNIANANTPGYSRQRLRLTPASPLRLGTYSLGRGVDATSIERTRNQFYDASYRRDNGLLGMASTMRDYLSQVEGAMNEPSDTGLASALDRLFASLSDLAGDPAGYTNREMVVSAANRMVNQLHSLDTQIGRVSQEAVDNLNVQVADVNALALRIADLNQKIVTAGGVDRMAPDLMDQRDQLIDELSQFGNTRVLDHADGTVGVVFGDTTLVDGAQASTLTVVNSGAGWGVSSSLGGGLMDPQSGSLKALVDLTQTKLPNAKSKLDQMAASLVTEFNAIHRTGSNLSGATNIDFFDPASTTAGTIRLSAAITASSDNIAASANGAQGNGDIVARLAGLATLGVATLGGRTFREHYVSLAASVGLDVHSADRDLTTESALVDSSDASRQSDSGVNVDDEMISLVASQHAYQAAARLISVADEMMKLILDTI